MDLLPTDAFGTPSRWLVVFRRKADLWWVNLIPGRFKHVSAFGFVPECDAWVFYDCGLWTSIYVARGAAARAMMVERTKDAAVLSLAARGHPAQPRFAAFSCTAAVANLLCIPTIALRPDALYRACIRHGAKIVGQAADPTDTSDRPGADRGRRPSPTGPPQGPAGGSPG